MLLLADPLKFEFYKIRKTIVQRNPKKAPEIEKINDKLLIELHYIILMIHLSFNAILELNSNYQFDKILVKSICGLDICTLHILNLFLGVFPYQSFERYLEH